MRRLLSAICAAGVLLGLLASQAASHSVDLDCSDFGFQAAAQDHRDVHSGDPDGLDDDDDGRACEELPCPCDGAAVPPPDLTAGPSPAAPAHAPLLAPQTAKARVLGVVDGETLTVRLATGEPVAVRLIGVDARARRARGRPVACGDPDATDRMQRLAFRNGSGRIVRLETDPTQDRQDESDRLLAYVDAGSVDFGRAMISSGSAKLDVAKPDFLRARTYRKAEASAKAAGRGVWRRCGEARTAPRA